MHQKFRKLTSNIYECFSITFTEFVYANGKNAQFQFHGRRSHGEHRGIYCRGWDYSAQNMSLH